MLQIYCTEEEPLKIFLMKILHAHYFEMKKGRNKENKGCRIAFNDKQYLYPSPSHSQSCFSEATNFNSL